MTDQVLPRTAVPSDGVYRQPLLERYRKPLLGALAIILFFAVWQAVYLFIPLNTLFMSKPSLIFAPPRESGSGKPGRRWR